MSNASIQPPPFHRPLVDRDGQVNDELWRTYLLALQTSLNTGAAPANSFYFIAKADGSLTNARNFGLFASGYVKIAVAGAQAIPSTVTVIPTSDLTGTLAAAQFPAALPSINGAAITGLIGTQVTHAVVTKAFADTPYTAVATDETVLVNAVGGAVTVKLPATATSGRLITVKKTDASANAVTINGNGNNIDGAATQALAAQWNAKMMQADGSNWFVVSTV